MVKGAINRSIGVDTTFQTMEKAFKPQDVQKKQDEKGVDRVTQIQDEIQNGQYKIDLKKTSEKMALNLLNL